MMIEDRAIFYLAVDGHGGATISTTEMEEGWPGMDQEQLLLRLASASARSGWRRLSLVANDATNWSADSTVDWEALSAALEGLRNVTSLSLSFEVVSSRPLLTDRWWSVIVRKLPPNVRSVCLLAVPVDMPLTVAALSSSPVMGSVTAFCMTCDESRFVRLEAMPGLSLPFCRKVADLLRQLVALQKLQLGGLILSDPAPSLQELGEAASTLDCLLQVTVGGCLAHGPPPPRRGLAVSNPPGTLVPFEIPLTTQKLFLHWSKVHAIKDLLRWSKTRGSRNSLVIDATTMIDEEIDFHIHHYFITQLDVTAYIRHHSH